MGNRHPKPINAAPTPTSTKTQNHRTDPPIPDPPIPDNLRLPGFFVESIKALYKEKAQGDGIHVEDFISMFQGRLELSKDLKEFLASLFRAYDRNRNKAMDIRELLRMLDEVLCGDHPEIVSGIFKMCDFDGDGFITKAELRDFMSSLAWKLQDGETTKQRKDKLLDLADNIFEMFDTDGDGKLTTFEFQQGCLKHPEMKETVQEVTAICIGKGF